jgi:hypothetical protein
MPGVFFFVLFVENACVFSYYALLVLSATGCEEHV